MTMLDLGHRRRRSSLVRRAATSLEPLSLRQRKLINRRRCQHFRPERHAAWQRVRGPALLIVGNGTHRADCVCAQEAGHKSGAGKELAQSHARKLCKLASSPHSPRSSGATARGEPVSRPCAQARGRAQRRPRVAGGARRCYGQAGQGRARGTSARAATQRRRSAPLCRRAGAWSHFHLSCISSEPESTAGLAPPGSSSEAMGAGGARAGAGAYRSTGCCGGGMFGGGACGAIRRSMWLSPSIIASSTPPTAAEREAARQPPAREERPRARVQRGVSG